MEARKGGHISSNISDFIYLKFDKFVNPVYNQFSLWLAIIAFLLVGLVINWFTFRKIAVNNN